MERYEKFQGFDAEFNTLVGTSFVVNYCAGVGYQNCGEILDTSIGVAVERDSNKDTMISLVDKSDSASVTTTWSYRTSNDEWVAGKNSDVFLVPNLIVRFKDVQEVSFDRNSTTCAKILPKLKFDLDSPENGRR